MQRWDAVVVGSGPAGSTAARELAASGARVLIVDRAEFPRYKPCGGGIALRTERLLAFPIAAVVETSVSLLQVRHEGTCVASRDARRPFARMVMRNGFDALLLDAARAAGAEFRPNTHVVRVEEHANHARVIADGFEAAAAHVIGADGANSVVAKTTGLAQGMYECAAWELEVHVPPAVLASFSETCVLGLGYRPWGYAWVFPKEGRLSVGVVLPAGSGRQLRAAADALIDELGLPDARIEHAQGHKVRSRRAHEPVASDRVALVGDAAGLADEFTQEGIFYAIRSGQLAAEAAMACMTGKRAQARYEASLDHEIMPELRAARLIGYMFYGMLRRFGGTWLRGSRYAGSLWESFFKAQRGDSTYARELARAPWLAKAAAARLDAR